jgi:acyl-CoA reductase-like NAD-dependent aldehyde dehydrogenase
MLTGSARDRFLALQEQLDRIGAHALLTSSKLDRKRPGYYVGPAVHLVERSESIDAIRPGGLSFGPDVILVPVDGHQAAVELANRNRRPHTASVFTGDAERFEACARALAYGLVNHNTATTSVSLRLPLQGGSGCGNHRPGGVFAQRNCTRPVASLRNTAPFDPDRMIPVHPSSRK